MTALAYYLLKVVLCSGILFSYYLLALKNKAFHQWNRFYLLAAVCLSITLPLVQIAVFTSPEESNAVRFVKAVQAADDYLQAVTISAKKHSFDAAEWLLTGYATGCVLLLALLTISLLRIRRLVQTHTVQKIERVKFVSTREPGTPFSFLRYIFWNENISLQSESGRLVFEHELVHVTEKHTTDKLFMQIVLSLFWCNPFFWVVRRELSFVHEFIADKKAVGQHGTAAFAEMILQAAFPQHYSSITNSFFQLSIKRRLAMLNKQNNPRLAYAVRLIALPLIAIVVFAFSVRTKEEKVKLNLPTVFTTHQTDTLPKKEKQIESVAVNKSKGLLTIYYTDGSCETMTEQEANNRGLIHDGGYANAKRGAEKAMTQKVDVRLKDTVTRPLVVVDGNIVAYSLLSAIDPNKIASINILKGDAAAAKYGNKGSNGVIEIVTKKSSSETTETIEVVGKPLAKKELEPVVVEGKPLAKNNTINTDANKTDNTKSSLNEVTVIGHPLEPIFEQTETPASVDRDEWRAFLSSKLQPFIENAVKQGAKPGSYVVNVRFLVNKNGSLSNIQALNNPGYNLDKVVMSIMPNSPKWKPAMQNGKTVNSYHTQPITFQIQEQ